jgi:uncharacterized membrane protein YphA (DoxX/SURF4 family)
VEWQQKSLDQKERKSIRMQRLYSEFPGAYPELGLLLLRLLTCGMFISFEGVRLTAMVAESHTVVNSLLGVVLIAASVLVLAGFLTTVAGLLMAVIEGVGVIFQIVNPANGGELNWIYSLLIAGAASTLTLTGPGGFSLDARIFGPKPFFIPMDNSASLQVLSSGGQKSSRSRNVG